MQEMPKDTKAMETYMDAVRYMHKVRESVRLIISELIIKSYDLSSR